jgi:D-alanyl-D-alanine carboxypeptidase
MAVSQNLWNANDRSVIASFAIPGGKVALRKGSVGNILAWCAIRWHNEVEPLVWPGNWGYAERPVRGATVLSNHASGTAVDLNAPKHPLATDPRTNFSPTQIAAVRRIMADTGGLIRWGGDYTGRKDGMHIEINDRVTQAQLDALWARLSASTRVAAFAAPTSEDDMTPEQAKQLAEVHLKTVAQVLPLTGRPGADQDDPYGHLLSADAAARQALAKATAVEKKLDEVLALLRK